MAEHAASGRSGGVPSSAGVAQLISRLRDEGVTAGEKAAGELVAEAEKQAQQILADARSQAEQLVEEARTEAARLKDSGDQALRLAGRDAMLRLERRLMNNFATLTRGLVEAQMVDPDFLRQLILEVTRQAGEESGLDRVERIQILLPGGEGGSGGNDVEEARIREFARNIMAESWREGVTFAQLTPGHPGIKVRLDEKGLEVDLTAGAIADVLLAHLQPRFRAVLHGLETD